MKKLIAISLVLMLCISALSISAFAANTVTVTAEVPADWTVAYCYYWGGDSVQWPGVQMTKSGNKWTADIPANSTNIIISVGDSSKQTVDLTVEVGKDVSVVLGALSAGKYTATVNGAAPAPTPAPGGYYVTGSSDVFSNWTECNNNGKMTEQGDIFVKEFTGVPAGDYSIKVNDGTWANSWGGNGENGNYDFNVAEANSTVIVKYNPADNTVTVEVNGAQQGGEVTPPPATFDAYYVTGSTEWLSAWTECNENGKMTEENGVYTKTFENVTAGTVELKVNVGSWATSWGYNGNNFKFEVAEGDDVTVTFDPATQKVSVAVNGTNVNPITGDMSLAGVGIALLAATAGVVALVGKKKEF